MGFVISGGILKKYIEEVKIERIKTSNGFGTIKIMEEEIVVPDGITEIARGAFSDCSAVKKIIIPEVVIKIANRAFSENKVVEEVVLPDSIREIGEGAFDGCTLKEDENSR